jgi:molybdenum cofactor biosynthesis protein B
MGPVSVEEHKAESPAPGHIRVNVVTVSDTRTALTDEGGRLAAELCRNAGFYVAGGAILPDDARRIAEHVGQLCHEAQLDVVLVTGGTGISRRDTTVEALAPLFEKTLPGYGELFRALSYAEIGAAAMLSRATAGTIGTAIVFTLPGSPAGVRLALEKLIIPELPHMVAQLHRHEHEHHHHAHHEHPKSRS